MKITMNVRRLCWTTATFFLAGSMIIPMIGHGQEVFSIDRASGSPFAHGDVLVPGPTIAISDSALSLQGGLSEVEIDGISSGTDIGTELLFSVDHLSDGILGSDVSIERIGGSDGSDDHPADVYRNPLAMPGENFLFRDGDGVANPLATGATEFGLREPYAAELDNTDAFDSGPIGTPHYMGPVFFTVGAAATGQFPTDFIFLVPFPGGPVIPYVAGSAMSLAAPDDIDAIFVLDDGDMFFSGTDIIGFSLSRSSPSLAAGSLLSVRYAAGAPLSPADVFILTGSGSVFLVPASSHGLQFDDNIDALDQVDKIDDEELLGDINGDGVVNLLDVAPFVDLISTGTFIPAADINGDGSVNLLDVDPFTALLSG